jgi:hypothetical protein
MTAKEAEELIKRVVTLEYEVITLKNLIDEVDTLKDIIYQGKPPAFVSLSMLTQNLANIITKVDVLRQDIQNIQINDKKSQNQIFYMLIILFITITTRMVAGNIDLEYIKKLFGL